MNNYTKNFSELSNSGLAELLDDFEALNDKARQALFEIVKDNPSLQNEKLLSLKSELERFSKDVKRLDYLKNMGFQAHISDEQIKIERSRSAIFWDIFGVVLGIFFMLSLYPAMVNFREISANGIGGMVLLEAFINAFLVALGFALFYKAMNRLIEYRGFKIKKDQAGLTIHKGELIVDSVLSSSSLVLEVSDDLAILYAGENKTPLISTSSGTPLFVQTLKELYSKLSN